MSYGENLADFFRRAASYVDKIFKGANPGELPIEQPTRFHLVVNRKTADALGLTIPAQFYIFADEVISNSDLPGSAASAPAGCGVVIGLMLGSCSVLENSGHSRPAPRDGSGARWGPTEC
jgi:hypothetical protein